MTIKIDFKQTETDETNPYGNHIQYILHYANDNCIEQFKS